MTPAELPRLLAGLPTGGEPIDLAGHEQIHGSLPAVDPARLIETVRLSGLRGRGGADFPAAVKLSAVAAGRSVSAVVVNGSETEPASRKDALLLGRLPHLVLDGAELAAVAVGAAEVIVKVSESAAAPISALEAAMVARSQDQVRFSLAVGPDGYVTGEESAVVQFLGGSRSIPTFVPPRPFQRGYRGRPTLIQNPETLAQMALIARRGSDWYRELGTAADPGSLLVTISGAIAYPGVYELAFGTSMRDLIGAAGGSTEPLSSLLVGGYFGTWVRAGDALPLRLARDELQSVGCSLGAGVVIALGESSCGLHESARIADYLAGESAGQCGPCVHGLAAIAGAIERVADGAASEAELDQLLRWCSEVRGRGACQHPNGAVRLVESALTVFAAEVESHRGRRCLARPADLPLPRPAQPARPARPRSLIR